MTRSPRRATPIDRDPQDAVWLRSGRGRPRNRPRHDELRDRPRRQGRTTGGARRAVRRRDHPVGRALRGPQEYVVGEGARREARLDPEHVCALVKRRMGDAEWRFVAHGKAWSAPAVSSLILKSLLADAAFATGEEPTAAVITVPAYFGDEERRATVLAGTYANLDVVEVLSEPIAAALAYGFGAPRRRAPRPGQGPAARPCSSTTSAAAPSTRRSSSWPTGASPCSPWRATTSSAAPTGTSASPCTCRGASARTNPDAEDPLDDSAGSQALVLAAERLKHQLSDAERAEVVVTHDGARATVSLSRAELEEMTAPLLRRTLDLTRACLDEAARRGVPQVDRVLLVGGSSRMPAVAELLRRELDLDPQLHDPELSVARGAAIYGEKTELERMVTADLRIARAAARRRPARRCPPRRRRRRLPPRRRRVRRAAGPGAQGGGDPRRHGRVARLRRARGERRARTAGGELAGAPQRPAPHPHQPLVRHGAGRPADHRGHGRRAAGPGRVAPRAGRQGADRRGRSPASRPATARAARCA